MAGLNFAFTGDNSNFMRALNEVTAGVQSATRQIEAEGGNIESIFNKIKYGAATLGIATGLKELVSQVASTRGEFQQLEIAFETMLGSAAESEALMSQLKKTAAITPFEMDDVTNGAKSLLAYGIEADKVNDTLIRLGDIAAGLSIPLNDLTYLYGTTMVQGRMFTQDLRQFQGRGIPIADELAKVLGIAKDKIGDAVTAGKVGAKEFEQAIINMTAEGSKFGGLMEKQSASIIGQWSNIEDAISQMFNEIGEKSQGVIEAGLAGVSALVENWQQVVFILGDVAAAYGAQKAYLMLDSAFDTAKVNYSYDAEIAQLQALLPPKEEAVQTTLQEAVASGKLTEAKAAQILAMREEAEMYLESLALKAEDAKQAEITAQANLTTALQEQSIAEEFVAAAKEKWEAAYDSADAIAEELAAEELETAQALASEAADTVSAASKEAKAASSAHVTAQQTLESASTTVNTAQTTGNTAATGVLTIAKEKLALAIAKVNMMLKANQFALVLGAVIALGYAIYELATYQTHLEKSMESANKAIEKENASMSKEQSELDELKKKLESAKKGTDEWKNTKDQIVSQFGKYHSGLDAEIEKTGDLTLSYQKLTTAIRLSAAARAVDAFRKDTDLQKDIEKTLGKLSDKLDNVKKVDNQGRLIIDDRGNSTKTKVAGNLKREIQQKAYEYVTGKDVEFTEKEKAYLNQIGFFSSDATFSSVYSAGFGRKLREKHIENKEAEGKIYEKFGTTEAEVFSLPSSSNKDNSQNLQKAYKDAEKEYNDAKALVKKMEENRSSYTQKQYEDAKSSLKDAKKTFEDLGGVTKSKKSTGSTPAQIESKQESAHQKLLDLMKQQAEERLKLQQQYVYEEWQNRIDLMDEGEAKVLAQQQLNDAKELASLEEQKQSAVKAEIARQKALFDARQDELAADNKKYAKQVFDPQTDVKQDEIKSITERYDSLQAQLLQKQEKAQQDRLSAAKESFNAYFKEYGSYEQQRLAIEEEYNQKISEASDTGERLMLNAQKDAALAQLDYDQWLNSGDVALAFGDISNLSKQTVSRLIADMEKYRSKIVETFDPEKIQKYEEALANLHAADVENSFGAFSSMVPEYFTKRLSLQKQINEQTQIGLELTRKQNDLTQRTDIQRTVVSALAKSKGYNLSKEDMADSSKMQTLATKMGTAASNGDKLAAALQKALENLLELNGEAAELEKVSKSWNGNLSTLKETLADLEGEEKFKAICEAVGTAADMVGDLASSGAELADALGAEGLGEAMEYVGEAMNSVGNIASGFAQGGLIGGIAAAAGEVMNWATKLIMAGDERHQKNIEALQERIDDLADSYDKLGEAADNAYSASAANIIEQQNQNLMQQKQLIRQQRQEEEAKKKTDEDKLKEYDEALAEIDEQIKANKESAKEALIGSDIKSAISDFADAYASAWEDGTDAAQKSVATVKALITSALTESLKQKLKSSTTAFYDQLAAAMADGILTEDEMKALDKLKVEMDKIAAAEESRYKTILDRYKDLDELREELTDISFDSVCDNFKSLLSDMESSTADFTESFTDMLRNALIDGLMDSKYEALLKDWYAAFATAMEDMTLSDEEREELRQQYDAIVSQGIADRNAINEIVGGGAYSQSATAGGWGTMGQDTAEELNGRFTALTELSVIGNEHLAESNRIALDILATLRSLQGFSVAATTDPTLLSIKDMMFLSTGYLEDISRYTRYLIQIQAGIAELNTLINQRL